MDFNETYVRHPDSKQIKKLTGSYYIHYRRVWTYYKPETRYKSKTWPSCKL